MLALTFLALLSADHPGADRPHDRAALVQVHDLARLSPEQARHLDGQSALFWVDLDSLPSDPDDTGGFTVYDCVAPPGPWLFAGIWFLPGQVDAEAEPPEGQLLVRARLRVLRWPPPFGFPAQVEYRLERATRERHP
jgi:hypothetical protein